MTSTPCSPLTPQIRSIRGPRDGQYPPSQHLAMFDNIDQRLTRASNVCPLCEKSSLTACPHVREFDYLTCPHSCIQQSVGSDRSVTAVIVQSRNSHSSNDVIGSENQAVLSHVSLAHGSPPLSTNGTHAPSPELSLTNTSTLRPFTPTYARSSFDGPQLPILRTQGTDVAPSPAYKVAKSLRNEGKSKSHTYIADLYDAVRAINKEWILGLGLNTDAPQRYPEQYAHAQFELGIRAWRNFFHSATPSSFQDLFALMHVAMASSCVIHGNDHAQSWNLILEEACQWQHLLSNAIEKSTFVKAMRRLRHPQASTTSSSFKGFAIDDVFTPTEHAMIVRLVGCLSSTCVNVAFEEDVDKNQQHFTVNNEQIRLSGMLQSNIIEGCTDFLDSRYFSSCGFGID